MRHRYFALVPLLLLSACWDGTDHATDKANDRTGTFLALPLLAGYLSSEAAAVSADGRVIAGSSRNRAGLTQAFRWTSAQGAMPLGLLPQGSFSTARAISGDGGTIVGIADGGTPSGLHAFRWTVDLGLTQLDGLPNANVCSASAVSSDGSVIVGTCLAPMNEAFRWTPATGSVRLGRFGTGSNAASSASTVSSDGATVGGAGHPALTGAVIWNASNTATIIGGLPGDTNGTILALSHDGTIAAGASVDANGLQRAFRWTSATGPVPLTTDSAYVGATPTAMSADGRRMTGWVGRGGGGPDVAVLWDASGHLRPVSDLLSTEAVMATAGWSLTRARGISADGRTIVGDGIDPDGTGRGWIVTLND